MNMFIKNIIKYLDKSLFYISELILLFLKKIIF